MKISARVRNSQDDHQVTLQTGGHAHSIQIAPKSTGYGSSVSGGELLLLALATCYCNDLYREAAKRGLAVEQVEVDVDGDSGADGDPLTNVMYRVKVVAQAGEDEIRELIFHTDYVAEIHNTLRSATPVILSGHDAVTI